MAKSVFRKHRKFFSMFVQSLWKCFNCNRSQKYLNIFNGYNTFFKRWFVWFLIEKNINSISQFSGKAWLSINQKDIARHFCTHYEMNKIYFRHKPSHKELQISFHYMNDEFSVNREFHFCRKVMENIDIALCRMRSNIEKELSKKIKKMSKKCNQNDIKLPAEINLEFRRGTNTLSNITFAELMEDPDRDQLEFQLLDSIYKVVINEPWVVNLLLPSTAMAGFIICPSKLELQFADRSFCKVVWSKAKLSSDESLLSKSNWIHCSNDLIYMSSNDDIGYYMKLSITPKNAEGLEGPTVEKIMKNELQPGPGPCSYQKRAFIYTSEPLTDPNEFRVVSYNLLADLYADSDYSRTQLFPYCPAYALKIDYRKQLYLQEIISYKSDIVCLQEVDLKLFNGDLKFILKNSEQELIGLMAQKGKSGEGVATFYNRKRFDFIETHTINIGENIETLPLFRPIYEQIRNNVNLMRRIKVRSTTLQITVLKLKNPTSYPNTDDKISERYLLVANTHLFFHPDADHIRLLQMGFSMLYLENVYNRLKQEVLSQNDTIAIIFCGDFNSTPDCGIYRLMTEQFVPSYIVDWSSNQDEAVKNLALQQPFIFRSAYGTPAYTNFTPLFSGCLDYIYYQTDYLSVKQIVPLPTFEELSAHIGIPSVVFPSDHLSLVADFKFC